MAKPTHSEILNRTTTQESGCNSPTLPLCRGVLDYDLTYNSSNSLTPLEYHDIEMLINSNCSARAVEFICTILEPECRPLHVGILSPCKRICKGM